MIRVVDSLPCEEAVLESDPWIPMKVTWEPRPAGRPLYLRISGREGGEVELKIDPSTGILVQAIVIMEPPQVEEAGVLSIDEGPQQQAPVLDRTPWGLERNPDGAKYTESVISVAEDLGFVQTAEYVELVFVDQKPARYVRCGNVTVAVSDRGAMAAIRASL